MQPNRLKILLLKMEFRASGACVLNSLTNFDKICTLGEASKIKTEF